MTDEELKENIRLSGNTELQWIRNAMKIIKDLQEQLNNQPKRVWTEMEIMVQHEASGGYS